MISLLAQDAGKFKDEIVPVPIKVKKDTVNFEVDEHPRPQTTLEGLKKLPTLFKKDGLVTAGSASVIKFSNCFGEIVIFDVVFRVYAMEQLQWFLLVKLL